MKYSFVVPIYNDAGLASDLCREMERTFRRYLGKSDIAGDLEIIFVDDGSQNDSVAVLKKVCDEFRFARLVALARNFGQHIAISAGYAAARGSFVGMLNVDQEDPPTELPLLLDALESSDCDIAGGLHARRDAPLFTRMTSYLFHMALSWLSGYHTPPNSTTMRVMKRHALDRYNSLTERSRYIPGLEMWLGFRYVRVPIAHQPRRAGKSSYNFRRRLRMAIASIISFSDFPLRLAVRLGLFIAGIGFLLLMMLIVQKFFIRPLLPGYTSTIAAIVFIGGVQIMVTGVASLYIGRILAEVQGRPVFVVRESYGGLEEHKSGTRQSPRKAAAGGAEH